MEKYEIKISIEFNAKDFLQAEKVKVKIGERVFPLLLSEEDMHSLEITLQRMERSGHE